MTVQPVDAGDLSLVDRLIVAYPFKPYRHYRVYSRKAQLAILKAEICSALAHSPQLARLARDRDCGRFEWTVLDWNQPAIDFYRSLGAESKSEWILQRVSGTALESLAARPLLGAD